MTGRDVTGIAFGEDSFEELYERAPCGLLSASPDGVLVRVNETLLHWTGYTRAELVGRPFTDLLATGSQLFYETRYLPVLRLRGELREVALSFRRSDGTPLAVLINSVTVACADGKPRVVHTAVFDSTARQSYERELLAARRVAENSEVRVRALQHASSAFAAASSEEALAAALAECARDAFAAAATAVLLVTESGELRLVAGSHPLHELVPTDAARPEADAMRSSSVVTVSSIDEASARFPAIADAMLLARVEGLSAVALVDDGAPKGVLVSFFGRQRAFDEHDVELHAALARQAVLVLSRIRLQGELERLASHDQLTGLANRKLLHQQADRVLALAARDRRAMAVIFIDLDGFKAVNDNLGHAMGDAVLEDVSSRLCSVVRRNDIVGRFGGDEFVVICEDAGEEAASRVAERIRLAVRNVIPDVRATFSVTASVGVALYVPDGEQNRTAGEIFDLADSAMYASKNAGKDRVTVVRL